MLSMSVEGPYSPILAGQTLDLFVKVSLTDCNKDKWAEKLVSHMQEPAHTHTHVHNHTHTHVHNNHTHMHVHNHTHMHVHNHTHTHVHNHTHMHAHNHTHTHVYNYTHTHVHNNHTHMHARAQLSQPQVSVTMQANNKSDVSLYDIQAHVEIQLSWIDEGSNRPTHTMSHVYCSTRYVGYLAGPGVAFMKCVLQHKVCWVPCRGVAYSMLWDHFDAHPSMPVHSEMLQATRFNLSQQYIIAIASTSQ
jgi:hypothetical protein